MLALFNLLDALLKLDRCLTKVGDCQGDRNQPLAVASHTLGEPKFEVLPVLKRG